MMSPFRVSMALFAVLNGTCLMNLNLMRILVIAVLGLTATPGYAVPVRVTFLAVAEEPFTEWDYAQLDSGTITSLNIADADGDGIASFVAEVVFGETSIGVRGTSVPASDSGYLGYLAADDDNGDLFGSTFPFVQSVAGDSLIVEWLGAPSATFSLGQPVTVSDGMVAGLDGVVHENPGITTPADLLGIDVPSLPTFTGQAEVVGLLTFEVIPEPSAAVLVLFAMASIDVMRRRRSAVLRKGESPWIAPT